MAPHPLDNPIWASLTTRHRALAIGDPRAFRYPAEVAPFLGVPGPGRVAPEVLERLVPEQDTALLLGPEPEAPPGYQLKDLGLLCQMVCDGPVKEVDGPEIVPLEAHRDQVLALTARVYPHYFRPRTVELGRYFGILQQGRLAAMIGERMGMPGFREVSAVCTHPDFLGRGYARRLLAWLSNDLLRRNETPFLHVSPANTHAKAIYDRNGYRTRLEIAFWSLQHASPAVQRVSPSRSGSCQSASAPASGIATGFTPTVTLSRAIEGPAFTRVASTTESAPPSNCPLQSR